MADSTRYQDWIIKADEDFAFARAIFEAADTAPWGVGYHAQQAVEKLLKAYLISQRRDFPKIHKLERLLELCGAVDDEFHSLRDLVQPLDDYFLEERYPTDIPPFTRSDVKKALVQAEEIKEFVLKRIKA